MSTLQPATTPGLGRRWHSHPARGRSKSETARRWAVRAALASAALVALSPFLYVISTSFKETEQLFSYPPNWIPADPTLENYRQLLGDLPFLRWTANTMLVATTVTVVKLLIDSMAGYALAQLDFRGRTTVQVLMFTMVMVPPAVLIIPLFFLVRDMGILDTYWALILPALANPIGIFMMRAFIHALPRQLCDAARLDNCSEFQIYWRIVLPMVKPGLVVVGTYTFLLQYVNFVWPLVATQSEQYTLLTTGLASLRPVVGAVNWGLISAGAVLAMVPITIVFLLFQRHFLGGNVAGALKH